MMQHRAVSKMLQIINGFHEGTSGLIYSAFPADASHQSVCTFKRTKLPVSVESE